MADNDTKESMTDSVKEYIIELSRARPVLYVKSHKNYNQLGCPIAPFILELQLAKKKTKTRIFEARLFLSGICSLAFKVSL